MVIFGITLFGFGIELYYEDALPMEDTLGVEFGTLSHYVMFYYKKFELQLSTPFRRRVK